MPPSEPAWWYGPPEDVRARSLRPAARLYGWIVEHRFRRRQPYRSRLPVICVGNFTAGGTGKTPLALLIAEHLRTKGEAPVFLTRGYGGRKTQPAWVNPAADLARAVGDEPLLLAQVAPTLVSRDRSVGARMIERDSRTPTVIVMDDGLQNPAIEKDLVIAVVDGARGVGNGEVIPAGPLRAPLEFQLSMVDVIVVNGGPQDSNVGASRVLATLRRSFPGPVLAAVAEPNDDAGWLKEARVVAYAGIGNPDRFFTLLERQGAKLAGRIAFPDHHAFSAADARRLLASAVAAEATLVTTEKDWVRLSGAQEGLAELQRKSRTLPIRLAFAERDAGRLEDLISTAVETGGYRRFTSSARPSRSRNSA